MSKQTAVEWLINKLENQYIKTSGPYDVKIIIGINDIEQAKAMEKEQIVNAYLQDRRKVKLGKALNLIDKGYKYYDKTYGGQDNE